MSDGGKGSAPRPYSVDQETFASNWDRIFSKRKEALDELVSQAQELGFYNIQKKNEYYDKE